MNDVPPAAADVTTAPARRERDTPDPEPRPADARREAEEELRCTLCGLRACWTA